MSLPLPSSSSEVVVVGGGFAGLTTGLALSAAGVRVTVLEAHDGAPSSFRGELIHPPGLRALRAFGLETALLEAGGQHVSGFAAFSGPDSEPVLLPYGELAGPGLGMDHGDMLAVFRSALAARPQARLVRARAVEVLREDGRVVGIRCDDGSEHRAALLVGADGRHSRLRGLLGIVAKSTLLSYTVAPGLEGDVLPQPGHGNVLLGAPGPILAYPYGRGRVRMVIDVPTGVGGGRAGLVALLRVHYAEHLPRPLCEAMLAAIGEGSLGGAANHAISTESCAVPGAVLVGDAAGASHPLTATGMTTVLNDVTVLLESLTAHGFSDEALLAYEKRRYRFARAREVFAQSLYDVLSGKAEGPRALRDGVFRYWRGSSRARRTSMDVLSGDDSSVTTFLAEYVRVVGVSGWEALAASLREGRLLEVARPVAALLLTAGECLDLAADRALETLVLERAKALGEPKPTLPDRLNRAARWIPRRMIRPGLSLVSGRRSSE